MLASCPRFGLASFSDTVGSERWPGGPAEKDWPGAKEAASWQGLTPVEEKDPASLLLLLL